MFPTVARLTWGMVSDLARQLVLEELEDGHHASFDPGVEARYTVEGLRDLVGLLVGRGRRKTRRAEIGQEQGQEEVKNLQNIVFFMRFII